MNGLAIEAVAAIAVGLFAVALVLQPIVFPEREGPPPTSPLDDLVDPEETPQGAAVAALREIEFDRATGKLSDEDYDFLRTKYTGLAVQAMRQAKHGETDMAPMPAALTREALEAQVAARVQVLAGGLRRCPTCGPRPEPDAIFCSSCGDALGTGQCVCGTAHLAGARFCAGCGRAVAVGQGSAVSAAV